MIVSLGLTSTYKTLPGVLSQSPYTRSVPLQGFSLHRHSASWKGGLPVADGVWPAEEPCVSCRSPTPDDAPALKRSGSWLNRWFPPTSLTKAAALLEHAGGCC